MTRYIDQVPTPDHPTTVKLVVFSFSRSGTLGIYNACNILGHRSYHTLEAFKQGVHHMKMLNEALESGLQGNGKPYDRKDFDKWFAGYDVIVEIPYYMAPQFVAAYPEAKFLLVERDPDALVRSWKATTFKFADAVNSFPLSVLRYFDPVLSQICQFCDAVLPAVTRGKGTGVEGEKALRQYYVDYITGVKRMVPSDRLHVVQLEHGLEWEQLCPILEEEIPEAPWPPRHNEDEFKLVMVAPLESGARRAIFKLSALGMVVIGITAWVLI